MQGKRIRICILILAVALLSGCGRQKKIGVCFRNTDAGMTPRLMHMLTDALKAEGYQVTAVGAASDQVRQNTQIRGFLEREYDLLIVEPVMTAEAQSVVTLAKETAVPVIFINHEPEKTVLESWERLCYIGCDLTQPGMVQNSLVESLPQEGDVNGDGSTAYLIISGPEDHMDANIWAGCCGRLKNARCLNLEYGDWSSQSGRKIAGRCIGQHGELLDVIFCMNEEMAQGALEAAQTAEKHIHVVGVGGSLQMLSLVAEGDITGTVCPDVFALTEMVSKNAQKLLSGDPVEKRTILDYVAVTKENVQEFLQ